MNPRHYTNTSPPVVFPQSGHPRQRRRRSPDLPQRSAGRRAGVRCAHREAGLDVSSDSAAGRVRQRDVGRRNRGSSPATPTCGRRCRWTTTRGLVYLPVSTPSNDYYGVRRPGANLFAESIVCLDAATGQRKWHYQIVHHGLVGLRPASGADADDDSRQRPIDRRGRAADQAGLCLRLRSRHGRSGVADRGARRSGRATSPASRRGRRSRFRPGRRRSASRA